MERLKEKYKKKVVPKLEKDFGWQNPMAVPKLAKVVLNSGTGQALQDAKMLDTVIANLRQLSGQQPVKTRAKKSISNFKIREGMVVGVKATLRGQKMYDFVDRLINVVLPRVRDFRGLPLSGFDGRGNYTLGIKEQTVFPEINPNDVEKNHGLDITIVTTAQDDKTGTALLKYLGFPFREK